MDNILELIERIKKLEKKVEEYEPVLTGLQEISSIPNDIDKLYVELQSIKDSKNNVKENLAKLSKDQNRVYEEVVKVLSERSKELEKEVNDCPIKSVVHDVEILKSDIHDINKLINAFKVLFIK